MKLFKNKIDKDFVKVLSYVSLIVVTFGANGFLCFVKFGFDLSHIFTGEFWAEFTTLFVSEMLVMFGTYSIQKIKDLKNDKIIGIQTYIDNSRNSVYALDKVTEAEQWLRDVYNYREKLLILEHRIRHLHSKMIMKEPRKDCKNYEKLYAEYLIKKEKVDEYKIQLEYIKKDKLRLELMIKQDKTPQDKAEITKLSKELDVDEYLMRSAKIPYKDVYWGHLLSNSTESKKRDNSPLFSEQKEYSKSVIKYLAIGLITTGFISALVYPALTEVGWAMVLDMLINSITLIFFMINGITQSNKIILGDFYKALEKRKSVYNQMLHDLKISKIKVVDKTGLNDEKQET